MAEAHMSTDSTNMPGPMGVAQNDLLMSGEVTYKGKGHQLQLTQTGIRLLRTQATDKTESSNTVLDVIWRRVLCACQLPMRKSKSLQRRSESAQSTASQQGKEFMIHYCVKNKKTNKVQCKNITLETAQGNADEWISGIAEKCKEGKPQKLLIIINLIGGKGTAPMTFEKRVQPLFHMANIELIVKVTERAKHAIEIVKTFDTSSVDGIIGMGGDGFYMEIVHGLTLRKQEEEGVDFNNPDAKLVAPTVHVGLIPTGTGNAVSDWLNGVIDVDTATLNIIQGEIRRANVFSVHDSGKLLHYAGLLLANGYFSKIMLKSDEVRWMKRARYPYSVLTTLLRKKKVLEFDVEVLKNDPEQIDSDDITAEGATAASPGWTKLGTKRFMATMAFAAKIVDGKEILELHPFYPGFDLLLIDHSSTLENLRFILSFFTRKKSGVEKDFVEWVQDIRGMRFRMVGGEEGASSQQQAEVLELCKLLDVDGEIMPLSVPEFDARLHTDFLPVFCAPKL